MPTITICSWNGEWMNNWFVSDGTNPTAFTTTFTLDGHASNTAATVQRSAAVIRSIDPDILALQEAPSRQQELDLFIATHLSDQGVSRYRGILGDSGGAQKLALLYKPAAITAQLTPHATIERLLTPWQADVDGDMLADEYFFTRTPLVVDLQIGGHPLQIIVAHTKSNFVNQGEQLWNNPATRQEYIAAALKSRRRISSEAMHIRRYLDESLAADPSAPLIVLGDLNDGPGLDFFEEVYLSHNAIDILVGSAFEPERIFTHAQHDVPAAQRYTAVFDDFVSNVQNRQLLLDHILLSPGLDHGVLRRVAGSGRVRHTEYNSQVVNQGQHREDRPSDHRPVSVRLKY